MKKIIFVILVFSTASVLSLWEFGVTTKSKIQFFDAQWKQVKTAIHGFDQLNAITFDETEQIIYLNDHMHKDSSILSLKIPIEENDPHITENIIMRTQNESITGIAFDPLDRNIYWTDGKNKKIYYTSIDNSKNMVATPKVLVDFANEDTIPEGIAIDFCRRKIYWTNSNFLNASIERASLDGKDRQVIIRSGLYLPHGIIVDQLTDRIFWTVNQKDIRSSIESADLDGNNRTIIAEGLYNLPFNLAVTNTMIYWTDFTHRAVWGRSKFSKVKDDENRLTNDTLSKFSSEYDEVSTKVKSFIEIPRGIFARSRYLKTLQNDEHCKEIVSQITTRLLKPLNVTKNSTLHQIERKQKEFCLNGGVYSASSRTCVCKIGFDGSRCESNECQNFCVHGTCSISDMGYPECTCQLGFFGERCGAYKCNDHCLNSGRCSIKNDGEPRCECTKYFTGPRCESNSTQICSLFCRILKYNPEEDVPFGCHDICEDLSNSAYNGSLLFAVPQFKTPESEITCRNSVNITVITLVAGVCICLLLVFLIVHAVRRLYKPSRPRIKKTFVVQKKMSQTPLTSRPISTEQCEITIENCCNMNICDTPCFDPKLLQENMSQDSSSKEDKQTLINHMEDSLY